MHGVNGLWLSECFEERNENCASGGGVLSTKIVALTCRGLSPEKSLAKACAFWRSRSVAKDNREETRPTEDGGGGVSSNEFLAKRLVLV